MATMQHRTSFALDETTIIKLQKLASLWRVSQAEVVRRAIERADAATLAETDLATARLRSYHGRGGLAAERADAYLGEVATQRADWRRGT